MRILALDLSKRSAGFACWAPGDELVASGAWTLGSEYTSKGTVFGRLHQQMTALHRLGVIEAVFYERPRHLDAFNQQSDANAHALLVGLAMHAESWADAMGCRIIRDVHMATWRRHFLGKMPRATKSEQLKHMALERCRHLGFRPQTHDQAEAIGILDYACDALAILPPWRNGNVLLPDVGGVA